MDKLLAEFSTMGTTDRDVLVAEFQKYVGGSIEANVCVFFLEMNDWNLQEAVGAYFDLQAKREMPPCMALVRDITVGDGQAVPPCSHFNKMWRVCNNGQVPWPLETSLCFSRGSQLGPVDRVRVPPLHSGQQCDITVTMRAPSIAGSYCGEWRMCTSDGIFFGETIWVIISVEEGGLLDLTQQLSSMSTDQEAPHQKFASAVLVEEDASPFPFSNILPSKLMQTATPPVFSMAGGGHSAPSVSTGVSSSLPLVQPSAFVPVSASSGVELGEPASTGILSLSDLATQVALGQQSLFLPGRTEQDSSPKSMQIT